MLLSIFILCLSHLVLASPVQPEYNVEDIEQLRSHFNNFKVKYNKSYAADEEELRFSYFKANLAEIMELRKRNPFAEFDINKFADRSPQEKENLACFKRDNMLGGEMGACIDIFPINNVSVPDALDYRDQNAVTPAQDQGDCCSSWAFSATGAVEGAFALKYNYLLKLSEQQLVECDPMSNGCQGGLMHYGLSTLIVEGGQQLEMDYPYKGSHPDCLRCKFNHSQVRAELRSCMLHENMEDDNIKLMLYTYGPLAIALDASPLRGYVKGIITDCNHHQIDHGVLLIGYGEENGIPYWLIKNSWGADWGEEGFAKVQRTDKCLSIGEYVASVLIK